MEENNVIDINARARTAEGQAGPLVSDGSDLAVAQKTMPILSTEAHMVDLLVTGALGAGVGLLTRKDMPGAVVGFLGGVAFGLAEKALLGPNVGVAPNSRMIYGVAALGTTLGAGYLSYVWL